MVTAVRDLSLHVKPGKGGHLAALAGPEEMEVESFHP
jgi:hypothetical protein